MSETEARYGGIEVNYEHTAREFYYITPDLSALIANGKKILKKVGEIEIERERLDRELMKANKRISELEEQLENRDKHISPIECPPGGGTYFIQASNGLIKIGKSTDFYKRIGNLSTMIPVKVWPVGFISTDVESELHEKFRANRKNGEWFFPSSEIVDFVLSVRNGAIP